jgi:hypothetical protein
MSNVKSNKNVKHQDQTFKSSNGTVLEQQTAK